MAAGYPPFVEAYKERDPVFYEALTKLWTTAMSPGELDPKTKILIVLALDALVESPEGVRTVAEAARGAGATEGQVSEALRLAHLVAGNKVLAAGTFAGSAKR